MRGLLALFAGLLLLAASACSTRGPDSPFVSGPLDPSGIFTEEAQAKLEAAMSEFQPESEYYLGPGDVITLSLLGRPDLLGVKEDKPELPRFTITDNPFLVLPYIGAVKVHGKTPRQFEQDLAIAYQASQVRDPVPVVSVEKYYRNQVTVLGSVKTPGRYDMLTGDTILDVVFKAGGMTLGGKTGDLPPGPFLKVFRDKLNNRDRAELSPETLLERISVEGTIKPRDEIIVPIDQYLIGGDLRYNLPLKPNDIVFVPPAGTVIVHGPVKQAKVVFLGPSLRTVAQVLTECGGLKFEATSRIEVVRPQPDGIPISYFMDARDILAREEPDFMLRDNDSVFVYEGPVRKTLAAIGSIFSTTVGAGVSATYNPAGP